MKKIIRCIFAAFTVLQCIVLTSCDQNSDINDEWGESETLSLAKKIQVKSMETPLMQEVILGGQAEETCSYPEDSITINFSYSWPKGRYGMTRLTISHPITNLSSSYIIKNFMILTSDVNNQQAFFTFGFDIYKGDKHVRYISGQCSKATQTVMEPAIPQ
jgi:hypothetical protein